MEYISVRQFAEKYGISERTVRHYCTTGRIEGAFITGKTWNIPAEAILPTKGKVKISTLLSRMREEKESKLKKSIKDRLRKIGKVTESYYLYELLKDSDMLLIDNGWLINVLQITLVILGIMAIVTQNPFLIAALVGNGLINLTIYLIS